MIKDVPVSEMERLLTQSMNGVNVLFEPESLRRILSRPTDDLSFFNVKNIERIQTLFTQFAEKRTLGEKDAFLRSLDSEAYEMIVRTYFHIVDSTLQSSAPTKH